MFIRAKDFAEKIFGRVPYGAFEDTKNELLNVAKKTDLTQNSIMKWIKYPPIRLIRQERFTSLILLCTQHLNSFLSSPIVRAVEARPNKQCNKSDLEEVV